MFAANHHRSRRRSARPTNWRLHYCCCPLVGNSCEVAPGGLIKLKEFLNSYFVPEMLRLRSFGYGCGYGYLNNKWSCVILKKQFRGYVGRANYYIYEFLNSYSKPGMLQIWDFKCGCECKYSNILLYRFFRVTDIKLFRIRYLSFCFG